MCLRRDDVCATCCSECPRGSEAWWFKDERLVRCRVCVEGADLAVELAGKAGGSAQAEGRRRQERRQAQLRDRFGSLTPIVNLLTDDPSHTKSWVEGGASEARVGAFLDRELAADAFVLHDRRIPHSPANIDHVIVARSGVWVVDSKLRSGKVEARALGPLWNRQKRLYIGGRDHSRQVQAMHRQREVVRTAMGGDEDTPVRAVLCLNGAQWGLFAHALVVDGVLVTWPGDLVKLVRSSGELDRDALTRIAARIGVALPPGS